MGVISACWREGVHVASVPLAAAVMNEAVSEHEKRVLVTSKTSKASRLCFLAVLRLMVTTCGCGSNSCKQPAQFKTSRLVPNEDFLLLL